MKPIDLSEKHLLPARERILLTAHELFYGEGVRATGVDSVIAEAQVTKVTFYRHFPSKSDLILAYLDYRHQRWMAWFTDALQRHGGNSDAIAPAVAEWLNDADFRGCAFINSVGELSGAMPEVVDIARRHKEEMCMAIAHVLATSRQREKNAQAIAIALAIDGAVVQVQCGQTVAVASEALTRLVTSLVLTGKKGT